MVENRFAQERIFVQKLWSRYEKWSSLVTLNGCKIVLDPKSKFLTNFVKFQIGVKWIILCEKRKKRGFFEKSQKSSWISTISKIRHYGSKTDVLGDILTEPSFTGWTTIISFLKKIGQIKDRSMGPPVFKARFKIFQLLWKEKTSVLDAVNCHHENSE